MTINIEPEIESAGDFDQPRGFSGDATDVLHRDNVAVLCCGSTGISSRVSASGCQRRFKTDGEIVGKTAHH